MLHLLGVLSGGNEPPLCKGRWLAKQDGGIVKRKILPKNNPSVTFGDSSLYTREPFFMSIYDLSIFLTSTAFVPTKAKPRIRRGKFYLIRLFLKFKYSSSLSKKLSYLGNSLSKYIVVINSSCVLKSSIVEKYIGFLKLI